MYLPYPDIGFRQDITELERKPYALRAVVRVSMFRGFRGNLGTEPPSKPRNLGFDNPVPALVRTIRAEDVNIKAIIIVVLRGIGARNFRSSCFLLVKVLINLLLGIQPF